MLSQCLILQDISGIGWRRPTLLVACLALSTSAAMAQAERTRPLPADQLGSLECQDARKQLDTAMNIASGRQGEAGAAALIEKRQKEAAVACLGGTAPRHGARPLTRPLSVSPAPARPAPPVALPAVPTQTLPRLDVQRPSVITSCDATGCWAGEGSRLPRNGTSLQAPGGPCTMQGAVFVCP